MPIFLFLLIVAGPVFAQSSPMIQSLVAAGTYAGSRWPDFSDYQIWLKKFYEPTNYAPAWIQNGQPTQQALAMIQQFKDAAKKGLEPEDYDASRWDARIANLKNSSPATFDVPMTVSAMRYVSDLRIGRINPKHLKFDLDVDQKKYDLADFLRNRLLTSTDIPRLIEYEVEPQFARYHRTEEALAQYEQYASEGEVEQLPVPQKTVAAGDNYAGVPALTKRLRRVGDLPADATLPSDPQAYDGALVEAVKRFQRRHGLADDGRIGADTVKQLNVPISYRVQQLKLTLERWRWIPQSFTAPPIIVNIPEFRLRAYDDDHKIGLEMNVVVGKAMRTQTPVFTRDMTYIVLRPYWNVPPGILRGEIVPAIQKDRGYIAKKNYEVVTYDGKVITSGEISDEVLAQLKAGKLTVRQKPGPANALGLVKLMFPNTYNVYLHSTPAPELFSRTRRDFSHGCIRVQKPAELTAFVLRRNAGWTLERVQQGMQSGPNDVTVKLAKPVPVFIVYGTAVVSESGEVYFYDDIYGHDAALAAALAKGRPYPK
ncbi:MAG TPA: L,D-transpeptidase family protein [Terriglobales bacterium]